MTALVALGEGDLDRVYTVKPEYAAVEGSSMYLKAEMCIRDRSMSGRPRSRMTRSGQCEEIMVFASLPERASSVSSVSYTHLDVYKRQAFKQVYERSGTDFCAAAGAACKFGQLYFGLHRKISPFP